MAFTQILSLKAQLYTKIFSYQDTFMAGSVSEIFEVVVFGPDNIIVFATASFNHMHEQTCCTAKRSLVIPLCCFLDISGQDLN